MRSKRRNVLKAVGGSTAITGISTLVGARGPRMVDIPVAEDPHGIREWESVPQSWAEHRLHARKVNEEVSKQFLDHPSVDQVGIVGGNETIGGKTKLEVEVEIWPDKETVSLPDSIDGVNISTREAREAHNIDWCFNWGKKYYDVPGGVWANNDNGSGGTFCCKVNDYSGSSIEKRLLTCAHIVNDQCTTDLTNTSFYMEGEKFADTIDYDAQKDWMVADITNSSYNYTNKIKLEDSTRIEITGWINQNGLETYVGWANVKKMGCATGLTKDTLQKISINGTDEGCTDWNGEGFQAGATTYKGDSGGPAYMTKDNGNHYMLGIVQQGEEVDILKETCEGNDHYGKVQGYQAEAFVNSTPYNFGDPS